MAAYIAKRLLLMLPTLLGVLLLTFVVLQFVPGGPVELPAAALMASNGTTPLLTAVRYTGGTLRVTEANTLNVETWRGMKKVATFDQPLASLPPVEFVNANGTAMDPNAWVFNLADGGTSITFGYARGTILIVR